MSKQQHLQSNEEDNFADHSKSVGSGLPKYLQKGYNNNNESDERKVQQESSRDKREPDDVDNLMDENAFN